MFTRTVRLLSVFSMTVLIIACGSDSPSFSILPDEQQFQQNTDGVINKIDILWVIDNSGSMDTSQQALSDNFSTFISDFLSKNYDFKMAVTTSDAYIAGDEWQPFYNQHHTIRSRYYENLPRADKAKFRDGVGSNHSGVYVIDETMLNIESIFTTNILQGINGYGDERPLQSLVDAFEHPFNQGFVRDDSFLAVIIVTDEDDFSHDGLNHLGENPDYDDPDLHSIQSYLDYLDNLTSSSGPTRRYNVSSIAIKDEDCRESLNDAFQERKIAVRVNELVELTDGIQGDLCGAFADELSFIANQILSLSTQFYLDREPIPETITVHVNGLSVPNISQTDGENGWFYNPETISVVFVGSYVPEQGATIKINFDPVGLDF